MTKADAEKTKMLLEKAIDLRILERKFVLPEKKMMTGFAPRFLETYDQHLDSLQKEGVTQINNHKDLGIVVLEYWESISGDDGADRLTDLARKEPVEFNEMISLINEIMDDVHAAAVRKRASNSSSKK